jgi:hypothetical protein
VSLVALITDFGRADPYVGEVELQLRRLGPADLALVHVSHDVPAAAIDAGAWLLQRCWPQLPDGAVCLAVVDPGVGTDRPAVAARAGGRWFVGPGNGLAAGLAGAADLLVRHLAHCRPAPGQVAATTFDGRDRFAPAAAHLAAGDDPAVLGPPGSPADLGTRPPLAAGTVVWIDHYGNLVTNLARDSEIGRRLAGGATLTVAGRAVRGPVRAFAAAGPGEVVWYWGSAGTLEIAVDRGRAADVLGARCGLVIPLPGP